MQPDEQPRKSGVTGVGAAGVQVAGSVVDALKGNPACLAAIVLSALFAVLLYFHLDGQEKRQHERALAMLQYCFPGKGQR